MAAITLGRDDFRDRVYACWLGKNIGGTLRTPYECKKEVLSLTYYDPVPTEPLPNDDLDLQLAWLSMLEAHGDDLCVADFADYWKRHLRSEEHTSELQSPKDLVCRLLLEKKKK